MHSGTLIMVGTFVVVMGFMPPAHIGCLFFGALCLGFGLLAMNEESKEEAARIEKEDEDESN